MQLGNRPSNAMSLAVSLMIVCHDAQFPEYENDNNKRFRYGKIIPMWNGLWTFSYHYPHGGEVIDYKETLALHPTKEIAEQMLYDVVDRLNLIHFGIGA